MAPPPAPPMSVVRGPAVRGPAVRGPAVAGRSRFVAALQLGLLLLLALLMLLPLLWLVSTSLKGPTEDIFTSPPALLPAQPSLAAYGRLFADNPMGTYVLNSTIVSSLAVLANLLFCSLAAYPLARVRFAGRGLVLALVVATILIPFQVVMIPLYLLMVQMGLRNTLWALIIPQAATAFGIFLLRQSFLAVPVELEEAARIDGCTPLGEWWNVMIPAARADLITLAMFVFIGTWSDFLWPLIILDDPGLYTLPLGLQQLSSSFSLDWRLVAAGAIVSILPVMALFVLLQRYILPSATGDAVKG
jgi:putative chitobiose transport system permease protein